MPTKHAKYSPSSFARRMQCLGSALYESLAPDTLPSKHAETGTFAHALGELCLIKKRHPHKYIGKRIKYELVVAGISQIKKQVVTRDIAYAVGRYYDYITKTAGKTKLHIEQRVKLARDVWGTADCLFKKNHTLYVVDYKNGFHQVDPDIQLIIYGLGALKQLKDSSIKKVVLVIVQPNGEGPTIKTRMLSVKNLKRYLPKIKNTVRQIEAGNITLCIGSSCKWCKGGTLCPERLRYAQSIKKLDLEVASITDLQDLLDKKKIILDYFNSIETLFMYLLSHGAKIPGYKVVKKRATTYWKKDKESLIKAFKKLKYSDEFIMQNMVNVTPRTPGQLKEILGEKRIAKMTEKRSSGNKLVRESEPGEPVNSLVDDFDD